MLPAVFACSQVLSLCLLKKIYCQRDYSRTKKCKWKCCVESLEPCAWYVQFPFLLIRISDALVILEQFSEYLL